MFQDDPTARRLVGKPTVEITFRPAAIAAFRSPAPTPKASRRTTLRFARIGRCVVGRAVLSLGASQSPALFDGAGADPLCGPVRTPGYSRLLQPKPPDKESESVGRGLVEIVERSLADIRPYPGNPGKNRDAEQAVADSIREYGFRQPIVVDPDDVIIAGPHALPRGRAARPRYRAGPIVAEGLTPDQARAYRIMDNRSHENATWEREPAEVRIRRATRQRVRPRPDRLHRAGNQLATEPGGHKRWRRRPDPAAREPCRGTRRHMAVRLAPTRLRRPPPTRLPWSRSALTVT